MLRLVLHVRKVLLSMNLNLNMDPNLSMSIVQRSHQRLTQISKKFIITWRRWNKQLLVQALFNLWSSKFTHSNRKFLS